MTRRANNKLVEMAFEKEVTRIDIADIHPLYLVTAATRQTIKYKRIAAFQTQHPLPLTGQLDHQLADVFLAHHVVAGFLADKDALRIAPDKLENTVRHQPVMQHHVRLLH